MWYGGGNGCGYSVAIGSRIFICVGVGLRSMGGGGMVGLG